MKRARERKPLALVLIGAGLIGKYLGPLLALLPNVRRLRVIDRDVYSPSQVSQPEHAGRAKAEVLAERLRAINSTLIVEPIVADIENLPLGAFRGDLLLTALDSKRARIAVNYAFGKLAIPYWIDAGVSAPSLVRVTAFARGPDAACYECPLDGRDYAAEQSYPCQPAFTPPPTNAPEFLGSLAASFQAAECARLLAGSPDPAHLNSELLYDITARKLFVTRLERRDACQFDHQPLKIRPLRQGPREMTLAAALSLGHPRANGHLTASLEVPGKLFVRELGCQCGERRRRLRLKGRWRRSGLTCPQCSRLMEPLGTGLANTLHPDSCSGAELARPLSALGLQPRDVIGVGAGSRVNYFELGSA